MKNRHDLPQWLLNAVIDTRAQYNPGEKTDYSITSLIQPPMVYTLTKQHQPEEDVADALQAWLGTACHDKLEEKLKDNPRYMVEERLYHTFHIPEAPGEQKDFIVSAQLDLYDKEECAVWDYKFSKLYSFTNGGKTDHEIQTNYQAYLLRKHGYPVNSIQIGGFGLDWAKTKTAQQKDYPPTLFCHTPYPMWADEDVEAYIKNQILEKEYGKLGQIRVCDESERWARPTVWKVYRKGRKSALRILNTEEEANEFLANIAKPSGTEYVEKVEGEDIRCVWFCNVREHCSFYQEKYEKLTN